MKNNINHLLDENINYNDASPEDVYSISTSESASSNLLYNSDEDSMVFDGFDNNDVYIIKNDATTDDIIILNEDDYIDYLFDDNSDVYIIESAPDNSDNDVIMLDSADDNINAEIIIDNDNEPIILNSELDDTQIIQDDYPSLNEEYIIDETNPTEQDIVYNSNDDFFEYNDFDLID